MSAVNHPDHYNQYEVEVIELIRYMDFDSGNAIKYILRAPFKGNMIQDLEKAIWYARDFADHYKLKYVRIFGRKKYAKLSDIVSYYVAKVEDSKIPASLELGNLIQTLWTSCAACPLNDKVLFEGRTTKKYRKQVEREIKDSIYETIALIEKAIAKAKEQE